MAEMAFQRQVCPECGGEGAVRRLFNRKAHVCHLCNGRGELIPMGDLYRMQETQYGNSIVRVSWWPQAQTMAAVAEAAPKLKVDLFDEGDDYIPHEPYTDLRHDLYPKDGTIGSAHGC